MQFKYIIFDYNGTLANDLQVAIAAGNHMLKFYGAEPVSADRFKETFTLPWIKFYERNGVRPEQIDIVKHKDEYNQAHISAFNEYARLFPGELEALQYLKNKGVKLGVLTVRWLNHLEKELKHLGIHDFFDAIVGETDALKDGTKKDKKGREIIEKLGITNPAEALFIGDVVIDVDNARQFGFRSGVFTLGWNSKDRLIERKPDYVFDSYEDILKLFH